ncbi:MAG: PAS domain-containing protein [Salinarimonas sp.]|nr:PAS domain-containing protein [Salinarimonas sp.]
MGMLARITKRNHAAPPDMRAAFEGLPVAVMICETRGFEIVYANPESRSLLGRIGHLLNIDPEKIIGTSIDAFHKNPSHQRRILSDPKNLPHHTRIKLADEYLDLAISPLVSARGAYTHAVLTWSIATDKQRQEDEVTRLMQMIDRMPINVMTCDPESFTINFVNSTSIDTLTRVEEHLPIRAKDLLGQNIDIFHKRPTHQRSILADPKNLPINSNIRLGPEVLNLRVSAITAKDGRYLGPMLTWNVVTQEVRVAESVTETCTTMTGTASELAHAAAEMTEVAHHAQAMAGTVSAATEELAASISEIASQAASAADLSGSASQRAGAADAMVRELAQVSQQIGSITEVIATIAAQTNLLALNATIEAARAGEAGRGFAVVAAEVKALADQTAQATSQIKTQIDTIQSVSGSTAEAISAIVGDVDSLREASNQIAAAVEEQSAAIREVTANMTGVSDAARQTGQAAGSIKDVSASLDADANRFKGVIDAFVNRRRED